MSKVSLKVVPKKIKKTWAWVVLGGITLCQLWCYCLQTSLFVCTLCTSISLAGWSVSVPITIAMDSSGVGVSSLLLLTPTPFARSFKGLLRHTFLNKKETVKVGKQVNKYCKWIYVHYLCACNLVTAVFFKFLVHTLQ